MLSDLTRVAMHNPLYLAHSKLLFLLRIQNYSHLLVNNYCAVLRTWPMHFEYHRHIRPGDVLTVSTRSGRSWTKVGRQSGELEFSEHFTEFRDSTGELVVTSRTVGVLVRRSPTT